MISEIKFQSLSQSKEFGYAAELEFFKKCKSVQFKPGLNIIFGPNGCGKSALTRMAALSLAAEQGGVTTVTSDWVRNVTEANYSALASEEFPSTLKGIKVLHDGQPVLYGNPRNVVGLSCGGAAFDDDFFAQGLDSLGTLASTGQFTMKRLHNMIAVSQKDAPFPSAIDYRGHSKKGNTRFGVALALLKGTIPVGQQTLIFDEPESGLAIPAQGNLFDLLHKSARDNNFQIIVATHSMFSLFLPDANYIEMEPGYLAHSGECVTHMHQMRKQALVRENLKADVVASPEASAPQTASRKKRPASKMDVSRDANSLSRKIVILGR